MHAFDYELHYNEMAHYYVVRQQPRNSFAYPAAIARESDKRSFWQRWFVSDQIEGLREPLVGYGGFWKMVDEAHISTIATAPTQRRRGNR
jgi:ribosomal protein S18 acetylase RimI-like enzyme